MKNKFEVGEQVICCSKNMPIDYLKKARILNTISPNDVLINRTTRNFPKTGWYLVLVEGDTINNKTAYHESELKEVKQ